MSSDQERNMQKVPCTIQSIGSVEQDSIGNQTPTRSSLRLFKNSLNGKDYF